MKKYTYIAALMSAGSLTFAGDFGAASQDIESSASTSLLHNLDVAGFYDDNLHAGTATRDQESFVIQSALNSIFSSRTAASVLDLGTRIGGRYNEDAANGFDDFEWDLGANANYYRILNARNVLTSLGSVAYRLDDDGAYGNTNTRGGEEYLAYSLANSVTTQLNDTLQSTLGFTLSGTDFDASSVNDRTNVQVSAKLSERLTKLLRGYVAYSYRMVNADDTDSDIHKLVLGGDYDLTATEKLNAELGIQSREIDNGGDSQNFFASLNFARAINSTLTAKLGTVYGADEQGNILGGVRYEEKTSWRTNAGLAYQASKQLSLTTDIDYLLGQYEGAQTAATEGDENKITWSTGVKYAYSPQVTLSASYAFTDSDSDVLVNNDYDRNRFSVGANIAF